MEHRRTEIHVILEEYHTFSSLNLSTQEDPLNWAYICHGILFSRDHGLGKTTRHMQVCMYPLSITKLRSGTRVVDYPNTQAVLVDSPTLSTILYLGANRYVHEVSLSLGTIRPPFYLHAEVSGISTCRMLSPPPDWGPRLGWLEIASVPRSSACLLSIG